MHSLSLDIYVHKMASEQSCPRGFIAYRMEIVSEFNACVM